MLDYDTSQPSQLGKVLLKTAKGHDRTDGNPVAACAGNHQKTIEAGTATASIHTFHDQDEDAGVVFLNQLHLAEKAAIVHAHGQIPDLLPFNGDNERNATLTDPGKADIGEQSRYRDSTGAQGRDHVLVVGEVGAEDNRLIDHSLLRGISVISIALCQ